MHSSHSTDTPCSEGSDASGKTLSFPACPNFETVPQELALDAPGTHVGCSSASLHLRLHSSIPTELSYLLTLSPSYTSLEEAPTMITLQ
ncbi:hypothetical protein Tco_0723242 [Tanacetum coccineum]